MEEVSKITPEELKSVTELQGVLGQIQTELGALEVRKHEVVHVFKAEAEKMETIKKELEEKYGKVNIDLKDGSYELIPEEDKE
tara:strand:+ start:48 stop:296 length:249 start_codon:yes stop_codon:yes gene_type:complete